MVGGVECERGGVGGDGLGVGLGAEVGVRGGFQVG